MKLVALLSGGLDSTVALAAARREHEVVLALTFDYGQRAAAREIAAASAIASRFKIPARALDARWLGALTPSALVNAAGALPRPDARDLDDPAKAAATAKAVWIPNRNGFFINAAAAFAEAAGAGGVVVGFNREEAATFPDNTVAFMDAATRALAFSTANGVRVVSPTAPLDKREIVRLGRELGAPLDLCWPCYEGGPILCGVCESCRRFQRAMESGT